MLLGSYSMFFMFLVFYFFFICSVQEFLSFFVLVLFLGFFRVKPGFFVRFMVKPKISGQFDQVKLDQRFKILFGLPYFC